MSRFATGETSTGVGTQTASKPPSAASKAKRIAILLLLLLLAGSGLYFGGLLQGRNQYARRLQEAERLLSINQNRGYLLKARGELYRAALDLERRNFGTANKNLDQAAGAIRAVSPKAADVDTKQLEALQSDINAIDLNVATDLEAQRTKVLEMATRVEQLTPEPAPLGALSAAQDAS